MAFGELHDDPASRVGGERFRERREVLHVVEDVSAHRDVGGRHGRRDRRPGALIRRRGHTGTLERLAERREHLGRRIDTGDHRGTSRESDRGRAATASDVEHGPVVGERFDGAFRRERRPLDGAFGTRTEQLRREGVRRRRRRIEDALRDGTRCKVAPPTLDRAHR
jgi:hypothetical protein